MDAIDIKLLKLLQHNAELTIQELSAEVHLSTTPCLLYTSPSPRDQRGSRMPSSA